MTAPRNLVELWSVMAEQKRPYLNQAQNLAEVTIPDLRPTGEIIDTQPHTHIGTEAVTSLSSVLVSMLVPSGVRWYEHQISAQIRSMVETVPEGLSALLAIEDMYMQSMVDQIGLVHLLADIIERLVVEHQGMLVVTPSETEGGLPELSYYPLRSVCVERVQGKLHRAMIEEVDFDMIDRANELYDKEDGNQAAFFNLTSDDKLYTLIDYGEGKVWQQKGKDSTPTEIDGLGGDVRLYVPLTTKISSVGSYRGGYANRYYGTFKTANDLQKGLKQAALIANWVVLLYNANNDPHMISQIDEAQPGEPLMIPVSDPNTDGKFLTAGAKISDWGFVHGYIKELESVMERAFAMGIARRRPKTRTAEEVIQVRNELETDVSTIVNTLGDGLSHILQALQIATKRGLVLNDDGQIVPLETLSKKDQSKEQVNVMYPAIITGMSAITWKQRFMEAVEGIGVVGQIDPGVVQRISGIKLLRQLFNHIGFDLDNVLKEMEEGKQIPVEVQDIMSRQASGDITPAQAQQMMQQLGQIDQAVQQGAGQAVAEEAVRSA